MDGGNAPGGEYTLILSLLGTRCRGGVIGSGLAGIVGSGGTSLSSAGLLVFAEKRLRTRLRTERIDRPPVEYRLGSLGRSKKSVRYDASSDAMGLEIPRTAPEEERWDQRIPLLPPPLPFFGSCIICCFF